MSDNDMVIANGAGATVRTDITAAFAALVSWHSGTSEPATTYPYMRWLDTANNLLKVRNAADSGWVTVASFDGTTWKPYYNGSLAESVFAQLAAANTFSESQTVSKAGSAFVRAINSGSGITAVLQAAASEMEVRTTSAHDIVLRPNSTEVLRAHNGGGVTIGSPTGDDQGAGSINAEALYIDGVSVGAGLVRGGSADLSSGTSASITDLGGVSDPDRITLSIKNWSLDGSGNLLVRVGDSGGLHTSGYTGDGGAMASGGNTVVNDTTGFLIAMGAAARLFTGQITLLHHGSNLWTCNYFGRTTSGVVNGGGGQVTLDTALDRVGFAVTAGNFDGSGGEAQLFAEAA